MAKETIASTSMPNKAAFNEDGALTGRIPGFSCPNYCSTAPPPFSVGILLSKISQPTFSLDLDSLKVGIPEPWKIHCHMG